MSGKANRQNAIRTIIATQKIASQEELQTRLSAEGYDVTQATLSRDLKELGVVKAHDVESGYSYRISVSSDGKKSKFTGDITGEGVLWISFSANLAVIKTQPGFASVVGAILDHADLEEVIGNVAGDDTVLIILKEAVARAEALESLAKLFKGIENKEI
ncbi:MAG: arginine repressor [Bacteroidales bacterium]|nr:arginine repressor [Bacteroidales bacterium]